MRETRPQGKGIREIRKIRGLTQIELARRAGLSSSYVAIAESGRSGLQYDSLKRVADVLGVPLCFLWVLGETVDSEAVRKLRSIVLEQVHLETAQHAAANPPPPSPLILDID